MGEVAAHPLIFETDMSERTVILHYHLFKNAGTSLDSSFKENFSEDKGEWVTKEFPAQPAKNREMVKQWIIDNPQAKCFSSHTVIFPVPEIEGVKIIPVIFYRHPIDRIVSAYTFEKKQGGESFGPTLARHTTLAGYIETRLSMKTDRQCRDFHSHRLATMISEKEGDEAKRAEIALDRLPFVGIVEKYSDSLKMLEAILKNEGFDNINLNVVKKNISRKIESTIEEKLNETRELIGEELWNKLLDCNSSDMNLYNRLIC